MFEMKIKSSYLSLFDQRIIYVLSFVSVLLGGVIYIFLRPVKPAFFNLLGVLGLENLVNSIRESTVPVSRNFPEWFIYTLPNGLWAFGYTLLILAIWRGSKSGIKYIWFSSIPVLIFGFELLQYTGNIRGTFALEDILSGLAGILIGIITTKLYGHEKTKV